MTDHDLLAAIDEALAEPVLFLELRPAPASAPGLVLEVAYDGGGILAVGWRLGSAWWPVNKLGEA